MTKKKRTIRIVVNSVLLVAIIALGVTVYQARDEKENKEHIQQQALIEDQKKEGLAQDEDETEDDLEVEEDTNDDEKNMDEENQAEDVQMDQEGTVDTGTAQVEAIIDSEADTNSEAAQTESADTVDSTVVAMAGNFTEDTLMIAPLAGDILLDYNMEETIYHPTLDVYKLSPAIAISAAVGSEVLAAADGTVADISENIETGTTVTVDMGNGYEAIYGQLKDLNVQVGQPITQSTIIGYVTEPTKYYAVEGSNLYFAMRKDGVAIDPVAYLP